MKGTCLGLCERWWQGGIRCWLIPLGGSLIGCDKMAYNIMPPKSQSQRWWLMIEVLYLVTSRNQGQLMQEHSGLISNVMAWSHVVTNKGLEDKRLVNFIYLNVWECLFIVRYEKRVYVADWSSLCGDQAKQLDLFDLNRIWGISNLNLVFGLEKNGVEEVL